MVAPWYGSEVGDEDDDAVTRFEPRFAAGSQPFPVVPPAPYAPAHAIPAYVIPSPLPLPPQQRIPMTAPLAIDPARLYYTGATEDYLHTVRVDPLPLSALHERSPALWRTALAVMGAVMLAAAIAAGVCLGYLYS